MANCERAPQKLRSVILLLFFLNLAFGFPGEELEPAVSERGPVAENYLRERLALWRRRLHLEDWTIALVMSASDRLRPATLGNIRWDPDRKTATIKVLQVSEYRQPFSVAVKDMEFSLVHELIHLKLFPLARHDKNSVEEERIINQIAQALLQSEPGSRADAPR